MISEQRCPEEAVAVLNQCPDDDGVARRLDGMQVVMLRHSDYSIDARARKEVEALRDAGAAVRMIGVGETVAQDLTDSGCNVILLRSPEGPLLGRENVWWPVRVAVNLTYTRIRERLRAGQAMFLRARGREYITAAGSPRPDVIHAHNIHTLPAAVRVKRVTGARIIYDCRDLVADVESLGEAEQVRFKQAESRYIGEVDAVITVSEPLAGILESRYAIPRPTVIYNGPSQVRDMPSPVHEPIRLLFQGKFAFNRNLAALIDAMCVLRGRASLTLQGFGGVEKTLREQVAALRLDDVVSFVAPANPLDVVSAASDHDVGVACYRGDSLNLESAVPNKLMDYLGAGLALAVSDLPGHRSVLQGTDAAIFIDPTNSQSIAEGVASLLDDKDRLAAMKAAALKAAHQYQWSVQAEKLLSVYARVLGTRDA